MPPARAEPTLLHMWHAILADVVLLSHLAFMLFVALGGVLVFRFPVAAWVHLPVLAYGVLIEIRSWTCPLTPLEQNLRRLAGQDGYEGGFMDHYLGGILYPSNYSSIHLWLAAALLLFNGLLYWRFFSLR
ncbi:MAG: DUF2784 domain-containing protein [Gemmatimonadota bacterium]